MLVHSDTVRNRFNDKQDRQFTYDLILRCGTIVVVEKRCFT